MAIDHADAEGVHKGAYVGAIDPAQDPDNKVAAGKLWVDTGTGSPVLRVRDDFDMGWTPIAAGALRCDYVAADTVLDATTDVAIFEGDAATPVTLTLPPAAPLRGKLLRIKHANVALAALTVSPASNNEGGIEGEYAVVLRAFGDYLTLMTDGGYWYVFGSRLTPA